MTEMKTRVIKVVALGLLLLAVATPVLAASDNWRNLNPKEKEKIIRNYQRWQNLPPQDKEHLRGEWDRWQRLPQDRRDRLKQRYDDQRRNRD
jgi:hypothetical protein